MYNVAPYVARCLQSLGDQDIPFEEYEIICINDGSPDNCSEVVRSLQKEIPNIILLEQENQGVSMARNNGIAIAKGKYMMPIDPDDYVVRNCLKQVLDQAEQNNLDILYAAFEIFDANHKSIWRTNYEHLVHQVDNGQDGYFAVRGAKVIDPDRSVAMLFKMNLLKKYKLNYPQEVPYLEDGLFVGKVLAVANRVGYSNADFYQRTTRAGSATNSNLFYTKKALDGFIKAAVDVKQFVKKNDISHLQNGLLNHLIVKFVLLAIIPFINYKRIIKLHSVISELQKNNLSKLDILGVYEIPYTAYAKMYNISPYYFVLKFVTLQLLKKNKKQGT